MEFTKVTARRIMKLLNDGDNDLVLRALTVYAEGVSEHCNFLAREAFAFLPENRRLEIRVQLAEEDLKLAREKKETATPWIDEKTEAHHLAEAKKAAR